MRERVGKRVCMNMYHHSKMARWEVQLPTMLLSVLHVILVSALFFFSELWVSSQTPKKCSQANYPPAEWGARVSAM